MDRYREGFVDGYREGFVDRYGEVFVDRYREVFVDRYGEGPRGDFAARVPRHDFASKSHVSKSRTAAFFAARNRDASHAETRA